MSFSLALMEVIFFFAFERKRFVSDGKKAGQVEPDERIGGLIDRQSSWMCMTTCETEFSGK